MSTQLRWTTIDDRSRYVTVQAGPGSWQITELRFTDGQVGRYVLEGPCHYVTSARTLYEALALTQQSLPGSYLTV